MLKRTLIELVHDEGYGEDLLRHLNTSLYGKDMRAERVVAPIESDAEIEKALNEIAVVDERARKLRSELFWRLVGMRDGQ